MANPLNLFQLLNEFIVMLLGGLMILVAVTRGVALPARPIALILLGAVLIYWGFRAWAYPEPKATRAHAALRGSSLVVVGMLVIAIPLMPLRYAESFLAVAGGVLVLRGLMGTVLVILQRDTPGKA